MTAIIYLMRHGASVWNRTKRISGQLDPPLAPEGIAQAQRLRDVLSQVPLGAIFTSSLTRSVETARPLAHAQNLNLAPLPALNERDFGELQGRFRDASDPATARAWAELQAGDIDAAPLGGQQPGPRQGDAGLGGGGGQDLEVPLGKGVGLGALAAG